MNEYTRKEYVKYFSDGETFFITKYFGEAVSKALSGTFDMKYCEKGRWWYSDWENHQRMVITLYALKGTKYLIIWGYNYDFIPQLTNQDKIIWHRTEKSFHLDIADAFYNHVTFPGDPQTMGYNEFLNAKYDFHNQYEIPAWTNNLEFALQYIDMLVRRNIPFMLDWFDRVKTIEDAIAELNRQIAVPSSYGHFNEYYTKAFLLARLNHMDEAIEAMEKRYAVGYINPKILEKLNQTSIQNS